MAENDAYFPNLLPSTPRRMDSHESRNLSVHIKDSFSLTALFTIGAITQSVLFLVFPAGYAIVPFSACALISAISTLFELRSGKTYPKGVVPGQVTAQMVDPSNGKIPAIPASQSLVVFHLGVRFNHTLGLISPGASEVVKHFDAMNADLRRRADEYGLYHFSNWKGAESDRNNTLLMIYYFRNVDGLNRFAHDTLHWNTWKWFNSIKEDHKHLGIFHETFITSAQQYETIYENMPPVLLGAASVASTNEISKEKTWVNTLVDADVKPLRTQLRRMGKHYRPAADRV
ncbi:hypothetical protein CDEST_00983 [Colletotrichum destructivum]|uniref:Monooxygenase n=1 Tax=Colletotrichum destructivum TaxID=34406 RepID=A0AAX4HZ22_9PEZI|nr:hypothetical protein CDEST_00983 [Colletotrichum destructivum]